MQFLRVFRFLALLWHNNQFYLEVPSPCCVVIALMQKYRLCGDDRRFLSCGCLIYQVRRTVHDHNIIYIYIYIIYTHNFLYDYNSFPVIQFFPRHWAKNLYKKISVKCFVVSYICFKLAHFLLTTIKLVSVQKFFEMPSGLKCLKLLYLWRLCF